MPIDVNTFSDSRLEFVTACGCVHSPEADAMQHVVPHEPRVFVGHYDHNGRLWVHLIINRQANPPGIHFHLDFARDNYFRGKLPKEAEVDNAGLDQAFAEFSGRQARFNVTCGFAVPRQSLRKESVINLLLSVSVGPKDADAQLTSSAYRFSAGPLLDLKWSLVERNHEEVVTAKIRSTGQAAIGDGFLNELILVPQEAFRNLVLEEGVN